jgi:tetratricopeptide (TPR) repeat protein
VPAVPLAADLPEPGERVYTIAAWAQGEENFWNFTPGSVRLVNRRHLGNASIANVVETDLPFNKGNSGGPMVNERGELVAVVEGLRPEARLVSLSVALDEVRGFLADCDRLVEPRTAADYYRRGSRREATHRYELAIYDYTEALRKDPSMAQAKVGRGHAFFKKGDIQTAMAELDDAVKSNPELAEAHLGRGACHLWLRRYDEALADFTQAIRRDAENPEAYRFRAQAYRATGDVAQSLSDYARSIALDPRDTASLSQRGDLYRSLKRYEEALADFARCSRLEPWNSRWYRLFAGVLCDMGKYERAVDEYSKAIQANGRDALSYYERGRALMALHRYEDALGDFVTAIKLAPDEMACYYQLGRAAQSTNRYKLAVEAYSRAIDLKPDFDLAYSERGLARSRLGDYGAAITDFAKAIELNPNDPMAYNNLAWILATCPDERCRDGQRAFELAVRACELTKYVVPFYFDTLAAAYAQAGDFDHAIQWQTKARSQTPQDNPLWKGMNARLDLYRSGVPYREGPAAAAS